MTFNRLLDFFFKINFFQKNISEIIPSEHQTVLILIRPDILSGLILIQNVCKGYQQMTKDAYTMYALHLTKKLCFSKGLIVRYMVQTFGL